MAQRIIIFVAFLIMLCGLVAYGVWQSRKPAEASPVQPGEVVPIPSDIEAAYRMPLPQHLIQPRMVVNKAFHTLELYSKNDLLRTYPVGLGMNANGPKRRQGDLCTPEGSYFVCSKNPHSKYYLALGLSYPNGDDARRALAEGLISESQLAAIVASVRAGQCPP